jgi:hypothetical protein
VTGDRFVELAPLFALGALDGDDLSGFAAHAPGCAECQRELRAHERVASLLPLGLTAIPPGHPRPFAAVPKAGSPSAWILAAAAALLLALGLTAALRARRVALDDARRARLERDAAQRELQSARRELAEAAAFRSLLQRAGTRVATLAGQAEAPAARARVVFDPASLEAVLLASGLQAPPPGRAYQAWVIGPSGPAPAGVFVPDGDGRAMLRLPPIESTRAPSTFAVTLEPAAGTAAPTGPVVLAGAA